MKNRNIIVFSTIAILFMIVTFSLLNKPKTEGHESTTPSSFDEKQKEYFEIVRNFTLVNPGFLEQQMKSENFTLIYVGRSDCPQCQIFVKELYSLTENKIDVHYLSTERPHSDSLKDVLEKYEITSVPTLMSVSSSKIDIYDANKNSLSDFINMYLE
ncbi:thioredoxin family protein [Vagococcus lutrae]|uniref:Thioredoxin family protein n=1 Tax=Vagococcus lutrae TaxID=81947 RepID=A0AAE9XIY6_9ENTE|nr:thioredoxin family protein [Vagococcus lutrae]WCG22965.1 thioredoxin family protein [Vagococcus lutrae]